MNPTYDDPAHIWASTRPIPCACDNVKVVCLLLPEEVEFDAYLNVIQRNIPNKLRNKLGLSCPQGTSALLHIDAEGTYVV